jgi:pyridoxamine 5'-phosphate oxidase
MVEHREPIDFALPEKDLLEAEMNSDPIVQFRKWYELAASHVEEANAMTLATADRDGRPSARVVLLKDFDERGFVFFTNYNSRKSQELESNPQASLVFWWKELRRQVRIEGAVERVSPEDSDAYFKTRPRGSRLGAWSSPQSQSIASRDILDRRYEEMKVRFDNQEVPRPENWGGYRLLPAAVEFWQSRLNRLHDRLRYRRSEGQWLLERLAP